METLGSRIALYRNSRRWTQERLASEIGVTQGLLSEIENDKVSPRWETINEIAEKLEVPILSLLPVASNVIINPSFNDNASNIMTQNNNKQNEQLWEALQKTQEELLATKDKLIQLLEQRGK
jgi:transcriptional regulator with XRE-family HTH domain